MSLESRKLFKVLTKALIYYPLKSSRLQVKHSLTRILMSSQESTSYSIYLYHTFKVHSIYSMRDLPSWFPSWNGFSWDVFIHFSWACCNFSTWNNHTKKKITRSIFKSTSKTKILKIINFLTLLIFCVDLTDLPIHQIPISSNLYRGGYRLGAY